MLRDGERVCDLERLRRSPSTVSGPGMVPALERIRELTDLSVPDPGDVPVRRLMELSRYGLSVRFLEQKAIDNALELLELLVANELVGTAVRAADKEMLRTHARLTDAAGSLRSAVRLLLDGINRPERPTLDELWESIEDVIPAGALEQAVATVEALAPTGAGRKQDWRAVLSARRIVTISDIEAETQRVVSAITERVEAEYAVTALVTATLFEETKPD